MKFHITNGEQVLSNERVRYVFAVPAVTWIAAALALTLTAAAAEPKYGAIDVGPDEALHLKRSDHKEETVRKEKGQTGFTAWAVSPDRRTVGWLALYPNPFPSAESQVPLTLVLFRNGVVLRRFPAEQSYYGWGFRANGKRVASCDGPPSGDATRCLLRDIETGKTIDSWDPKSDSRPAWATGLH